MKCIYLAVSLTIAKDFQVKTDFFFLFPFHQKQWFFVSPPALLQEALLLPTANQPDSETEEPAGLSVGLMDTRLPSPLISLSASFSEGAADERAHHWHQTPVKCIKGNAFGSVACFERKQWSSELGRHKKRPQLASLHLQCPKFALQSHEVAGAPRGCERSHKCSLRAPA